MLAHYYKIELYHGKYDRIHQLDRTAQQLQVNSNFIQWTSYILLNLLKAHTSKINREYMYVYSIFNI